MSTKYNDLKSKVLFGKYRLDKIIGKGSFGSVFHGTNIKDNSEVAIKLESKNSKDHLLELECSYLLLLKGYGIPDVKSYGRSGQFYALVLELLGINLRELKNLKKDFSIKDVLMLAIQIIDRIEYVHSKYIVHRDIKPENFLLGYKNNSTIYIIDFGISKKYRSSRTGKHIRYSKTGKLFGTIRYCTYNATRGLEQSRRDDLESIGHMLIFLAKGYLPWINIKGSDKKKTYFKILNLKKNTSPEILCKNLPNEFLEYMNYCKKLKFEEKPDYEYLKGLLQKVADKNNIDINAVKYDWEIKGVEYEEKEESKDEDEIKLNDNKSEKNYSADDEKEISLDNGKCDDRKEENEDMENLNKIKENENAETKSEKIEEKNEEKTEEKNKEYKSTCRRNGCW